MRREKKGQLMNSIYSFVLTQFSSSEEMKFGCREQFEAGNAEELLKSDSNMETVAPRFASLLDE